MYTVYEFARDTKIAVSVRRMLLRKEASATHDWEMANSQQQIRAGDKITDMQKMEYVKWFADRNGQMIGVSCLWG